MTKKKNPKRKLRSFMNPDSNFIRQDILKQKEKAVGGDQAMQSEEEDQFQHKSLIQKIKYQIEFYLGDSNLVKDNYLKEKLNKDPCFDLSGFLDFNRIKNIFSEAEANQMKDDDQIQASNEDRLKLIREALKPSKMLKLSKDGLKVKRRIPFKINQVDVQQMDESMIYVERFPSNINHENLCNIFKRAGKVRHVSLPKYKNSGKHKGFAFIEYAQKEDAQRAIQMFNNTIPEEFVNLNHPNYIQSENDLRSLNVLSKLEWNVKKKEIQEIKRELSLLMPHKTYVQKQTLEEAQAQEEKKMKDSDESVVIIYEEGSILKVKNLPDNILQKYQLAEQVRHFSEPTYVELRKTQKEGYIRFQSKQLADAFLEKISPKNIKEEELQNIQNAGNIFLKEGRDKVQITQLKSKELKDYVEQAKKEQIEYHEYLKRVKKFKNLKRRQKKADNKQHQKQQKEAKVQPGQATENQNKKNQKNVQKKS